MLASLLDLSLLFCPNANSYRRFQANSYSRWSRPGESTTVPEPAAGRLGLQSACRAPHLRRRRQPLPPRRSPGVHRGNREGIDPGVPVEGNGYAQAGKRLPTDWLTAPRYSLRGPSGVGSFRRAVPRRLPGGKAREYRQFEGRGRRAGLALVPDPGLRSRPAGTAARWAGCAALEQGNTDERSNPSPSGCGNAPSYYAATLNEETDYPTKLGAGGDMAIHRAAASPRVATAVELRAWLR